MYSLESSFVVVVECGYNFVELGSNDISGAGLRDMAECKFNQLKRL